MKKAKGLFYQSASEEMVRVMKAMDYQTVDIVRVQKKRIFLSLLIFIVFIALASMIHSFVFFILSPFIAFGAWMLSAEEIRRSYHRFQFKRQYDYNKFREKLLPLLHGRRNNLYSNLQELLAEQPNGRVKDALSRFLIRLNEQPNQVTPFLQFADEASGTDEARTFMQTLFDFQQNTDDMDILDALSLQASEELFRGIDDISQIKLNRIMLFPSLFTMSVLIPILGFVGLKIWNQFISLNLW